jgi:hypothetical protein
VGMKHPSKLTREQARGALNETLAKYGKGERPAAGKVISIDEAKRNREIVEALEMVSRRWHCGRSHCEA